MQTDILNPSPTDELNPDYGFQKKRPVTHLVAKANDGPPYFREVTDVGHQFVLNWGTTRDCAKLLADIQRLKRFYEQFRDGFFTIIDWDNKDGSGNPRHHVGRFASPVEPQEIANLWYSAQQVIFEELPDVPMVLYPGNWTNDSIWRYTENDFGEVQPALDNPANWTLVQDAHSAMSVTYGSTQGYDLQSSATSAYAQLSYVGWGFQFWAPRGPDRGIAQILLDGVSQGDVDQYTASAGNSAMLLQVQNVPLGKHIVQLVVTGTKNGSSSGYTVCWDALKVMR